MRKHGVENVEFILLEDEIPDDILDDRECYWIEYYGTFGPGGLNCDGGGRSRRGFTVPQDVRDKISASLKGREFSDETRAKISAKKAGENHHFYGKKMSEEFSRKLSERSRGEGNPRALLKETDVVAIIARLATGEKYGPIAADYSVGRHVIGYIYRGVTWKYIERPWNV